MRVISCLSSTMWCFNCIVNAKNKLNAETRLCCCGNGELPEGHPGYNSARPSRALDLLEFGEINPIRPLINLTMPLFFIYIADKRSGCDLMVTRFALKADDSGFDSHPLPTRILGHKNSQTMKLNMKIVSLATWFEPPSFKLAAKNAKYKTIRP